MEHLKLNNGNMQKENVLNIFLNMQNNNETEQQRIIQEEFGKKYI